MKKIQNRERKFLDFNIFHRLEESKKSFFYK